MSTLTLAPPTPAAHARGASSPRTAALQAPAAWDDDDGMPAPASCEQLLRCDTALQAEGMVRQLAVSYGFDHFLYGVRIPMEGGSVFEHIITNYPQPWRQLYQDRKYAHIDPTVRHCTRHVTPLTWDADNYTSKDQMDMFEQARTFGLRSGISIPVHGCRGETAMLSLAMDSDDASADRFIERTAPLAQRLASYAHESLRQCLLREVQRVDVHLTPRENECLRWVAQGKTNWEMARILVVSEHAITYHLRNVMGKLQVSSRHQAVRRAVALGLLEL